MFGFTPTQFDGTEIEYTPREWKSFELPAEYSFLKYMPPVIDQGAEPICVPSSLSTWLNWKLNSGINGGEEIDNGIRLRDIYKEGRKYEEEELTAGDEGMTFKAALKYLRKEGAKSDKGEIKIKYYAVVNSHLHLRSALFMNGPCFGALPVYNSERNEFWNPDFGALEGYHAVALVGYTENGIILRNSWGKGYGRNGYWEIPYLDTKRFIEIWTIIQ